MRDDGPELTPDLLLHAYQAGIFPMAETRDDTEIFWVDPKRRGVFPLDRFHVSRSLAKRIRTCGWTISRNTDFEAVVAACADREETWISTAIEGLYKQLYRMGQAHSLEIRERGLLIGGVYGVTTGTAFFGESMFSRRTDASKVALAYLTKHLHARGFTLFDTQFLTDHLASLGAREISRAEYHKQLHDALQGAPAQFVGGTLPTIQDVLQRRTQTS